MPYNMSTLKNHNYASPGRGLKKPLVASKVDSGLGNLLLSAQKTGGGLSSGNRKQLKS